MAGRHTCEVLEAMADADLAAKDLDWLWWIWDLRHDSDKQAAVRAQVAANALAFSVKTRNLGR